jgi:uncharacterized protein
LLDSKFLTVTLQEFVGGRLMGRLAIVAAEFAVIFVVVPLLIYKRVLPNLPIPFLLVVALGAFLQLRRNKPFDPSTLWNAEAAWRHLPSILVRDLALIAVLGILVWQLRTDLLFSLPKRSPVLWAAIMILYPILSVYPQEILFRAYFFQRYTPIFGGGWGIVVASALAFGFVHIIFGSWISIVLSTIGGLLFALTYMKSGSLLLTCIEHALFGDFIFTIGLGQFFYHGARR